METEIASGSVRLRARVSRPLRPSTDPPPALVLCHGFPRAPGGAPAAGHGYSELADRLAAEAGWLVLFLSFRGCGTSEGNFSLSGWLDDAGAAVDHLLATEAVSGVWLAGEGTGASIAICRAAEDARVLGVAALGTWPEFGPWAADPAAFLAQARQVGAVRSPDFPPDLETWSRELKDMKAVSVVGKIPPRPLLLIHGADDRAVPVEEVRSLAEAALGQAELRVLAGAGHQLRHDPRAVAVLLGWLDRQTSLA